MMTSATTVIVFLLLYIIGVNGVLGLICATFAAATILHHKGLPGSGFCWREKQMKWLTASQHKQRPCTYRHVFRKGQGENRGLICVFGSTEEVIVKCLVYRGTKLWSTCIVSPRSGLPACVHLHHLAWDDSMLSCYVSVISIPKDCKVWRWNATMRPVIWLEQRKWHWM